jgi:hypothetical protein
MSKSGPFALVIVAALAPVVAAQSGSISFAGKKDDPVSSNQPRDLVAVDADGNGKLDLVNTCLGWDQTREATVSVNSGKGKFGQQENFTLDPSFTPYGIGAGDLDNDGNPDLVFTDSSTGTVMIWQNTPATTPYYAHVVDIPTAGTNALDVVCGDFDHDGDVDLAVVNYWSGGVRTLRGHGDFGFDTDVLVTGTANDQGMRMTTADLDHDGNVDLLVATASGAVLLLGKGDGTFPTRIVLDAGHMTNEVEAADLDQDGKLDVVFTEPNDGALRIFRGHGDGTFTDALDYATGHVPSGLALADFDGDGVPDIAMTEYFGATVYVYSGVGDLTLRAGVSFATHVGVTALVATDLSYDGLPDLAFCCDPAADQTPYISFLQNQSAPEAWRNRGHGLDGGNGLPLLLGSGTPAVGQSITMALSHAKPNATTFLIAGLTEVDLPLMGGALVPAPTWILPIGTTDGGGALTLGGSIPSGIPPGLTLFAQDWIVDSSDAHGFAASNGLEMVTQ